MGCGTSVDPRDAEVGQTLKADQEAELSLHKLLLLGSGNSGKSTFMKQLCSIHGMAPDVKKHIEHIRTAVIHQMAIVIDTFENIHYHDDYEPPEELRKHMEELNSLHADTRMTEEVATAIRELWADPMIKEVYEKRNSLSIVDSAKFFFDEIDRIASPDYVPTEEDYLLIRIKTTGVVVRQFTVENNIFQVHDVGGQRSERSKWINCFDIVDAVLFVASMACYDQMLHEDENVNAMRESLGLFEETINNRYFKRTGFILFLNKSDLFQLKLTQTEPVIPFKDYFPEYEGEQTDVFAAQNFILAMYKAESSYKEEVKPIFHHFTCATDKGNVQKVFDDVQNHVVMEALKRNGLL